MASSSAQTNSMGIDLYKSFNNPITRETFRCISFNEEAFTMEWIVHPGGYVPFEHVHVRQDEIFHILDGEVAFLVDGKRISAQRGQTLIAPKWIAHTYLIESPQGARMLVITSHGEFEGFVRQLGRKPDRLELPPPVTPSAKAIEVLTETARQFGIEIVGPPMT